MDTIHQTIFRIMPIKASGFILISVLIARVICKTTKTCQINQINK